MFRTTYVFCLVACLAATSANAQGRPPRDAINLSQVQIYNSPTDVASWPVTTAITSISMRPRALVRWLVWPFNSPGSRPGLTTRRPGGTAPFSTRSGPSGTRTASGQHQELSRCGAVRPSTGGSDHDRLRAKLDLRRPLGPWLGTPACSRRAHGILRDRRQRARRWQRDFSARAIQRRDGSVAGKRLRRLHISDVWTFHDDE